MELIFEDSFLFVIFENWLIFLKLLNLGNGHDLMIHIKYTQNKINDNYLKLIIFFGLKFAFSRILYHVLFVNHCKSNKSYDHNIC